MDGRSKALSEEWQPLTIDDESVLLSHLNVNVFLLVETWVLQRTSERLEYLDLDFMLVLLGIHLFVCCL